MLPVLYAWGAKGSSRKYVERTLVSAITLMNRSGGENSMTTARSAFVSDATFWTKSWSGLVDFWAPRLRLNPGAARLK
jgi:hypothetical protein